MKVMKLGETLLGEPLGKNHKIETIKTLNIYISSYQAIIRSYMKQYIYWVFFSILGYLPRGSPNKYEHLSPRWNIVYYNVGYRSMVSRNEIR